LKNTAQIRFGNEPESITKFRDAMIAPDLFEKVFDLTNVQAWRRVHNLNNLKAEIVRAYGYIDTLTPSISNLRTEINELRQQLAQLAVPSQPDDTYIQELGNTGINCCPGYKTRF
jgi:hypothetical protein